MTEQQQRALRNANAILRRAELPTVDMLLHAVRTGESFMSGFEDDDCQETVTADLEEMRKAITPFE